MVSWRLRAFLPVFMISAMTCSQSMAQVSPDNGYGVQGYSGGSGNAGATRQDTIGSPEAMPADDHEMSITELSKCSDVIATLRASQASRDTYNILARMASNIASKYEIQDANGDDLQPVKTFLFSASLSYCQSYPDKNYSDAVVYAKNALDAKIIQAVGK